MNTREATVVGMGFVGMSAALELMRYGLDITCVGPIDPHGNTNDTRSTALFPDSVALLERLKVWPQVRHAARPLKGIRIVDASGALFRAPEITFHAEECGLDALAMNVPNRVLHRALAAQLLDQRDKFCHIDATLAAARQVGHGLELRLSKGVSHHAPFVVAADGRNSILRAAAQIDVKSWSYNQVAIACTVDHTASHDDISTEFHRTAGPLTVVPGPATNRTYTSHLVWIETPDVARTLMELNEADFRTELDRALDGLLGMLHVTGPRGAFPIQGQTAKCFARDGVFLVGETAHVIPPIGAQGMNLGFRDVRGLGSAVAKDVDRSVAETSYNDDRRNDVFLRTTAVDLLNRSLTTPYWPVQALRGAGLHMLNALPALKKATIQAGFGN